MASRSLPVVAAVLLIPVLLAVNAPAATYTWQSAVTGNASEPANWSPNGTPGSGDDVIFDGTATGDCTWDLAEISSFTVNGYEGTITVTAGLSVYGDVTLNNGTLSLDYATMDVYNDWKMSGGAIFSVLTGSEVRFSGGSDARIELADATPDFENVWIGKAGGSLTLAGKTFQATGLLSVSSGTFRIADASAVNVTSITVGAGAVMDITGGSKTITTATLNLYGGFLADSSSQTVQSPASYSPGLDFSVFAGSTFTVSGLTLHNLGAQGLYFHAPGPGAITLNNVTFDSACAADGLLNPLGLPQGRYTFDRCVFNGSVAGTRSVSLPSSFTGDDGSYILMTNATGTKAGPAYEDDTKGAIFWSTAIVAGCEATAVSSETITWCWPNDPDAAGYRVYCSTDNTLLAQLAAGTTQFLKTGLSANTSFSVSVEAYNPIGASSMAVTGWTQANTPAGGGCNTLDVDTIMADWDTDGNPEYTGYAVECSTNADFGVLVSSSPWMTAASYPFSDLCADTDYYCRVKARNGANLETGFRELGLTRTGCSAPGNFTGTALSTDSIRWTWIDTNKGEAGYQVCDGDDVGKMVADLPADTTEYVESGFIDNDVSTRCVAFLGVNNSMLASPIVTCHTLVTVKNLSGIEVSSITARGLTLNWTRGRESSSRIEGSVTPGGSASIVCDHLDAAATTFFTLEPLTTYYFTFRVYNGDDVLSTDSVTVTACTLAESGTPENFAGTVLSTGSVRWTWTDPNTDEAGYNLYSSTGALIASLPPNTTEYVEANLPDNARCERCVSCMDVLGGRVNSPTLTRYTFAVPPPPAGITAGAVTAHGFTLNWERGRASSFRIVVSTAQDESCGLLFDRLNAASAVVGGLPPATTYYASFRAYNGDGLVSQNSSSKPFCTLPVAGAVVDLSSAAYVNILALPAGSVTVELPQGTMSGEIYVDINTDPLHAPGEVDPARITAANAQLLASNNGRRCLTDSITEFNMYTSTGVRITASFSREGTIRLPFSDTNGDGFVDGAVPPVAVRTLQIFVLNETLGRWEPVESALDAASRQMVAHVRHFSVYALISVPVTTTLDNLRVHPNPFKPGSGTAYDRAGGIVFSPLTSRVKIKIFSVAGDTVFETEDSGGTGFYEWPAVNNAGEKLGSGLYFYIVTDRDSGKKAKGKLVIVR